MKYIDIHTWEREKPDEKEFKESIIALLCDYFCHDDVIFVLTHDWRSVPVTGSNVVVFLGANEQSYVPLYHKDVGVIYTDFWNPNMPSNVLSIPLGLNERTSGRFLQTEPVVSLIEREKDVCFIGSSHGAQTHRREMLNALHNIKNYKRIVKVYDSFFYDVGAPSEKHKERNAEYLKVLQQTKISLCPGGGLAQGEGYFPGWESYRFSESLRLGNIIITNINWCEWYKAPNVFYIKNWRDLDNNFIKDILDRDINEIQKQGIVYYKQKLSRPAILQHIIQDIEKYVINKL